MGLTCTELIEERNINRRIRRWQWQKYGLKKSGIRLNRFKFGKWDEFHLVGTYELYDYVINLIRVLVRSETQEETNYSINIFTIIIKLVYVLLSTFIV